jgi:signal transduction histidine kinase
MQISLDLVCLVALIHFSGGIENPFIFYFIFHMIIASILLSHRAAFLQATFAMLLFCLDVVSEYFGVLHHYCLGNFIIADQHKNVIYISGVLFVFVSSIYIAVYMATAVTKKLREKEMYLEQANEQLEEKDRIKSEYVLRVSHDIKEHLSAVQSCLDAVTNGMAGDLSAKQADLLSRADIRAEKLMVFVKALLEITRIKLSKEIEMRDFSLKQTVENALSLIEARAKDKNITVTCDIDPDVGEITGAQVYIEETIANILANSVKYTFVGGKISVAVQDKDDHVLISISDTGIGIPKDEIRKVFDEFYRASNARLVERDGTGLGLSIAKQVIERHNGKIWVESEERKGSTFDILLPKHLTIQ